MATSLPAISAAVTPLSQLTPASERAIEVEPALSGLLPDGGLRRGCVVTCTGVAARSLALSLAARPIDAGAWLAIVGVPDLGIEAAIEHGIDPERVVAVASGPAADWAERLVAAADGFEMLLTSPPPDAERYVRKLRQRLTARGNVLLAVRSGRVAGGPQLGADVELSTSGATWVGIGHGHGRLMARRITIRSSGRRVPRPVALDCWLPGHDGRIDVAQTGPSVTPAGEAVPDGVTGMSLAG